MLMLMSKYVMKAQSGDVLVEDEEPVGFPPDKNYRFVCTPDNGSPKELRACAWVDEKLLKEVSR